VCYADPVDDERFLAVLRAFEQHGVRRRFGLGEDV